MQRDTNINFVRLQGLQKVNNKPIGLPKAQRHKDPFDKSRLRLKDNRYQIPTLRSGGLWIFQLGNKKIFQFNSKNECTALTGKSGDFVIF